MLIHLERMLSSGKRANRKLGRQPANNWQLILLSTFAVCLQCFDAVGWAAGMASGL